MKLIHIKRMSNLITLKRIILIFAPVKQKRNYIMTETGKRANNATISDLGIRNATVHWNLSPEELAKISIEKGEINCAIALLFTNAYTRKIADEWMEFIVTI